MWRSNQVQQQESETYYNRGKSDGAEKGGECEI